MGKRVLVILAPGNEESEAVIPIDIMKRANLEVTIAALNSSLVVQGAHNISITAEVLVDNCNSSDYDAIFLPGGMPGTINLLENSKVISLIKEFDNDKKLISAICAAPRVLGHAAILRDRKFTCFPGAESYINSGNYCSDSIVVDENIITGKAMGVAHIFALKIVETLTDIKISKKIAQNICL